MKAWGPAGLLLAVAWMLWPVQSADFAINDDHRIVGFLERRPDFRPSDVPAAVVLAARADAGRFRPGFWALWLTEISIARDRPFVWHLDRLLLALLTAAALFRALVAFLAPPWAALLALQFFCGFQNEAWMRLEVQEAWAAPLVALGLAWIVPRLGRERVGATSLLPGLAIIGLAGLVKESFIPLLPGLLVFVFVVVPRAVRPEAFPFERRDRLVVVGIACLAIVEGACAWRAWRAYGPYYGGGLGASGLARNVVAYGWLMTKDSGWVVPLAVALVACRWRDPEAARRSRAGLILVSAAVVLFLVPQWIVIGDAPLEGRYLIPGNLVGVFGAATGVHLLTTSALSPRLPRPLMLGAVALVLAWFGAKWMVRDHGVAVRRAADTRAFQAVIAEAADVVRLRPETAIVFRSDDPWDYELVRSAATFLAARSGTRPRAHLVVTDARPSRSFPLNERLTAALRRESEQGDALFRPLRELSRDPASCLELTFRVAPGPPACARRTSVPIPE
jgi:hypothetical protein